MLREKAFKKQNNKKHKVQEIIFLDMIISNVEVNNKEIHSGFLLLTKIMGNESSYKEKYAEYGYSWLTYCRLPYTNWPAV